MLQQIKALTTNPGDLGSIPRPRMVEGENRLPHINYFYIKKINRKKSSAFKSTCSFGGLRFDSQNPQCGSQPIYNSSNYST